MNNFEGNLPRLWKKIGSHNVMALATCSENRVTSRSMSVVVLDGKFYCQTNRNFLKYQQILHNANVALCSNNFSIEGVVRDVGKPLDIENSSIAKEIKKHFLLAYKAYSGLEEERLLEIAPMLIYSWSYELTKPYMEYWDFEKQTYRKEYK